MTRTALVVDDSRSMRLMIAAALEEAGFVVLQAEHGRAGLAILDTHAVDLVMTDLHMPVMDGVTFVRELRARQAHTPILLLTTEAGAAQKAAGKAAGATGWLVKPFDPQQLRLVVARVVP